MSLYSLFHWTLIASAVGSLMALFILAFRLLLGRRLRAAWRWALWALLILRLVLPSGPGDALSLLNALPEGARSFLTASAGSEARGAGVAAGPRTARGGASAAGEPALSREGNAAGSRVADIASLAWLSGALALAAFATLLSLRLHRRMRDGFLDAKASPRIIETLEDCRRAIGLRRPVLLGYSVSVGAPSVYGLLRPRILLPPSFDAALDDEELRFVLLHELAHVRRMDHAVNAVVNAFRILHWFNPLLWLVFGLARRDAEEACDELALDSLPLCSRKKCCELILRLAEAAPEPRPALVGAIAIVSGMGTIKRRIEMIMGHRPISLRRKAAFAALAAAFAIASLAGAQAMDSKTLAKKIQSYGRSAKFGRGALTDVAKLAANARYNFGAIDHAGFLLSRFGYHTGALVSVAIVAANADREIPELSDILDSCVLNLTDTLPIADLAIQAYTGETANGVLRARIDEYKEKADFLSLDEAMRYAESQLRATSGRPAAKQTADMARPEPDRGFEEDYAKYTSALAEFIKGDYAGAQATLATMSANLDEVNTYLADRLERRLYGK